MCFVNTYIFIIDFDRCGILQDLLCITNDDPAIAYIGIMPHS